MLLLPILVCLTACSSEQPDTSAGEDGIQGTFNIKPDFVMETDSQPDCAGNIVYTEAGYYTLMQTSSMDEDLSGFMLQYYDYESGQQVPVCGKMDCDHNNVDCNAYFADNKYPLPLNSLWYYEHNLYIFCVQQDYYGIERISMDGSERETSCTLYRTTIESGTDEEGFSFSSTYYPEVILHRGYAWFSTDYPGCKECGLYRVRLNSSDQAEEICTQGGDNPKLYRLKGYGDYLFFEKGNFIDEEGTQVDIDLYACDLNTGDVTLAAENVVRDYTIGDNCIYYFDLAQLDSIMRYDLETGETAMIYDSEGNEAPDESYLFVRDGNLYYSTSSYQYVFDESGEMTGTLKGEDMVLPYGDGE